MKPSELTKEQHYFFLTFYDKNSKVPNIKTVIYIGKNILTEKKFAKRDEWYFQDAESFLEYGTFSHMTKGEEREVFALEKKDLSSIYDLDGLIGRLKKIHS